jgi:N-acetylglucosamine kinase-like BadF-type ATPase
MIQNTNWLIGESGSTKCDWLLFEGQAAQRSWSSSGFNLRVQGAAAVRRQLAEEVWPLLQGSQVSHVFFYGPSLSTPDACAHLAELLREGLGPSARIEVAHDLLAAARATCAHRAGVVGILGTGSNACRYDGQQITESRGGWGYLLGDEGSGMDLGRSLLKAALDGELNAAHVAELEAEWGQTAPQLARSLYDLPRPNVRLAELAPALLARRAVPPFRDLVQSRIRKYIELSFVPWMLEADSVVHVVGSIAAELEPELARLLPDYGLRLGRVVARPLAELADFHLNCFI